MSLDLGVVALAALVPMVLGSFWYSPVVFGNHWLTLSRIKTSSIQQARLEIAVALFGSFLASFIMSFVLAMLIENLFVITAVDGMVLGFWIWLGFVATTMIPEYLFGGSAKPYLLYVLNAGYHLLALISMGGLLALWM